jgi:hypothetical protein
VLQNDMEWILGSARESDWKAADIAYDLQLTRKTSRKCSYFAEALNLTEESSGIMSQWRDIVEYLTANSSANMLDTVSFDFVSLLLVTGDGLWCVDVMKLMASCGMSFD